MIIIMSEDLKKLWKVISIVGGAFGIVPQNLNKLGELEIIVKIETVQTTELLARRLGSVLER